MILGDINKIVCLNSIKKNYFKGDKNIYIRETPAIPLLDYIPNNDELSEDQHEKARAVGDVSLELFTTSKAEEHLASNIPGLVSVIVPTFKDEDYITQTLESIANQDYSNLEIIVINDGSNDNTADLTLEFMATHSNLVAIKFVRIPHMGHPGISRNIGLYNLLSENTEFIAFMDGDDLYASTEAISVLVASLKDSCLFASYGDYDMISDEGKIIARPRCLKKNAKGHWAWKKQCQLNWGNIAVLNINPFHLQCMLIRKNTPFIPYSKVGEDADFYARLFKMSANQFNGELDGITQVPVVIAHYRKRLGSITNPLSNNTDINRDTKIQEQPETNNEAKREGPYKSAIADGIPPFYLKAGMPEKYFTARNISHWVSKRRVRMILRSLFSGNLKDVLFNFRVLLKDGRVRKIDLLTLPFTQLFADSAVTDLARVMIGRIGKRNKFTRK